MILFLAFVASSAAQTPPTAPASTLPSETPAQFTPVTDGFDYARRDVMIPMRDGVKLHTVILVPKGAKNAPILLTRTPYDANDLTTRAHSSHLGPSLHGYDNALEVILEGGYIRVVQDIRGKYGSEGDYVVNRPLRGPLNPTPVDHATDTGLHILYEPAADVGADRIVDAVAAIAKYGAPCVVVDFGTATTFNAINAKGEYMGGAITPGILISSEALFARTAKLPRVDIKRPHKVIGSSTVEAMQSGLYYGYVGLVDGVLEKMIEEIGSKPRVIATGGLAQLIATGSKFIELVDDTLTLEGLRLVYSRTFLQNRER